MRRRLLYAILIVVGLAAQACLGWGGRDHVRMNYKACLIVPDEMSAWREYAQVVGFHGYNPDLWKSGDPDEGPRHYIDLEDYGALARNLPRVRPESIKADRGIAPWTIMETMELLTETMREGDWDLAARIAAALGHYVTDTHQPLHCTVNFDGADPDTEGVHIRWEIHMSARNKSIIKVVPRGEVQYLPDPWTNVTAWVVAAHDRYPEILDADRDAAGASGNDLESDEYFEKLWELTDHIFLEQIGIASVNLASVWYTAWVNAGKPAIPPPPTEMARASFHHTAVVATAKRYGSWTFLIGLGIAGTVIVGLSVRKQRQSMRRLPSTPSEAGSSSMKDFN